VSFLPPPPLPALFFSHLKKGILIFPFKRWLFEKYDGVRGFWNPFKGAFYSRQGNQLTSIPQEIIDAMPQDLFLDGELWYMYNTNNTTPHSITTLNSL